jgi:hypothetical protein
MSKQMKLVVIARCLKDLELTVGQNANAIDTETNAACAGKLIKHDFYI